MALRLKSNGNGRATGKTPSTVDDFPTYSEAYAKYREVRNEQRGNARTITDLTLQLGELLTANNTADDVEARAQQILAGDFGPAKQQNAQDLQREIEQRKRDQFAYSRAAGVARERLETARAEASAQLAAQHAPAHRKAVAEVAAAVERLQAAVQLERSYRLKLEEAGADPVLPPMVPTLRCNLNNLRRYAAGVAQ